MATNLTSATGLPPGWKREESLKQSGLSSGKTEVHYVSPGGRKLKSRVELQRALGDRYDLTNFDWRTGRFAPYARPVQQQQQQHHHQQLHHQHHHHHQQQSLAGAAAKRTPAELLAAAAAAATAAAPASRGGASSSSAASSSAASVKASTDASLRLPMRQTASMLKQSVELVRSHPDSKRNDLQHGPKERPRQLFYHKRFDGLRACDPDTGEARPEVGLPKHLLPAGGPVSGSDQLVLSVADCLSGGGAGAAAIAVVGQQHSKAFEKNPHVAVNPEQPLVRYHLVSDEEVRRQEAVVKEARRRLALALRLFNACREASAA